MTDLRTAAQQALKALNGLSEDAVCQSSHHAKKDRHTSLDVCPVFLRLRAAITALKAALEEPVQEPVAWMVYTLDGKSVCVTDNPTDFGSKHKALPLYTAPPQRQAEPAQEPEPAGWFEGPFGEFRANPLHRIAWPAQTVAWSIPLYLAPPQRPAEPVQEPPTDAEPPCCGPDCTKCSRLCKRTVAIDSAYASRLAFMLECLIVDYHGHWDEACSLLDQYRSEWEEVNPTPPTSMGEPLP